MIEAADSSAELWPYQRNSLVQVGGGLGRRMRELIDQRAVCAGAEQQRPHGRPGRVVDLPRQAEQIEGSVVAIEQRVVRPLLALVAGEDQVTGLRVAASPLLEAAVPP